MSGNIYKTGSQVDEDIIADLVEQYLSTADLPISAAVQAALNTKWDKGPIDYADIDNIDETGVYHVIEDKEIHNLIDGGLIAKEKNESILLSLRCENFTANTVYLRQYWFNESIAWRREKYDGSDWTSWGNLVDLPTHPADVGLDQVDNTSDLDKPISIAVQTALNDKADAKNFYVEDGEMSYTSEDFSEEAALVTQVTITNSDFYDMGSYHALVGGGNFTTSQSLEITTTYDDAEITQMHSLSTVDEVVVYYHVTAQSKPVWFDTYYGSIKIEGTDINGPRIRINPDEWVKIFRQNGVWYVHGVAGQNKITLSDGTYTAQMPALSGNKNFGTAAFADTALPTAAGNIALLDASGNIYDSELQPSDIGGGGMTSDITTLSGTSLSLEDGKVYKLVPSGNTTFTLPTVTDTTKTHQIEIYLSANTVYTYTFPQGCLYVGGTAPVIQTGTYRLIFEYEPTAGAWTVGAIEYGAVS